MERNAIMASAENEEFRSLISELRLSSVGELSLRGLPMLLMPRHFFRYILREVNKVAGHDALFKIYRQAGYDGAISFCEAFQKSHKCTPKQAVQGYLDEMNLRGWGQFSIQELDAATGTMEVLLRNSALRTEEDIPSGNFVWEGAMLGAMVFLQKQLSESYAADATVLGFDVPGQGDFKITITRATP
jgi:hypothetical protein